ncbi:uncharacterized protein N7459_008546 [Penicillium hispanicum]|uniref:uncharacterized protein n=1 Tax=Penicillium hispanicum TaxID=1080232 RepID=UPI0025408BCD|nr:uncharacterized protein N7459_008546 [Penicillium hispanicum]KAJ5574119.1 hypothetical protein N7459_008546 [Penicillium hispanicum]
MIRIFVSGLQTPVSYLLDLGKEKYTSGSRRSEPRGCARQICSTLAICVETWLDGLLREDALGAKKARWSDSEKLVSIAGAFPDREASLDPLPIPIPTAITSFSSSITNPASRPNFKLMKTRQCNPPSLIINAIRVCSSPRLDLQGGVAIGYPSRDCLDGGGRETEPSEVEYSRAGVLSASLGPLRLKIWMLETVKCDQDRVDEWQHSNTATPFDHVVALHALHALHVPHRRTSPE